MTAERWVDLLLNVFTEALGIIVTVFLVDRIIKRREEARWKPSKNLAYTRLFNITTHILTDLLPSSQQTPSNRVFYKFAEAHTATVLDITDLDWSKEDFRSELSEYQFSMNWENGRDS